MATIQRGDLQARFQRAFGMRGVSLVDMDRTLLPVVIVDDIREYGVQDRVVAMAAQIPAGAGTRSGFNIRNPVGSGFTFEIAGGYCADQNLILLAVEEQPTSASDLGTVSPVHGFIDAQNPGLATPQKSALVVTEGVTAALNGQYYFHYDESFGTQATGFNAFPKVELPPGWGVRFTGVTVLRQLTAGVWGYIRPQLGGQQS